MAVVQDVFFIPNDIEQGLTTGLYCRKGGVVRYAEGCNKGQIVKLLEPIDFAKNEQAQSAVEKAVQLVKQHKKGAFIAAVSVLAIGTGMWVCNKIRKHEPKIVMEFRISLRVYIDAIRNGNMDGEKISSLMDRLYDLMAYKDYKKLSVELTTEELEVLLGRIYEYTIKLAKDNQIELGENNSLEVNYTDAIIHLHSCLQMQKYIFDEVA